MKNILAILAALLLGSAAFAHEFKLGDLKIGHPHMPAPPKGAMSAAGYFTITNTGTTDDSLTGITAGFAKQAMVHGTKVDAAGVARMTDLPVLDIPAGATVTLEPGALHVMFMGISGPMPDGAMLPATLTFAKAGTVNVEFKVDKPGAKGATDDMDMDMDMAPAN